VLGLECPSCGFLSDSLLWRACGFAKSLRARYSPDSPESAPVPACILHRGAL